MPFGIVAYALMFFSWTTFLETAVCNNSDTSVPVLQKLILFVTLQEHFCSGGILDAVRTEEVLLSLLLFFSPHPLALCLDLPADERENVIVRISRYILIVISQLVAFNIRTLLVGIGSKQKAVSGSSRSLSSADPLRPTRIGLRPIPTPRDAREIKFLVPQGNCLQFPYLYFQCN